MYINRRSKFSSTILSFYILGPIPVWFFANNEVTDISAAEAKCEQYKGSIVTPTSKLEFQYVLEMMDIVNGVSQAFSGVVDDENDPNRLKYPNGKYEIIY